MSEVPQITLQELELLITILDIHQFQGTAEQLRNILPMRDSVYGKLMAIRQVIITPPSEAVIPPPEVAVQLSEDEE